MEWLALAHNCPEILCLFEDDIPCGPCVYKLSKLEIHNFAATHTNLMTTQTCVVKDLQRQYPVPMRAHDKIRRIGDKIRRIGIFLTRAQEG
jgi:hypothetical protein